MAQLTLENLTKSFGKILASNEIHLCVEDGEFLILVGPSGCGKSTILRMIAGLETPTKGRIFVDGRDITRFSPKDRNVAMVFQNYALYPHMTVRKNLSFGLRMRKVGKAIIRKKVDDVSRSLGIDALLDRYPSQLSGGQKQRVALGRAIIREPSLFLLDEPLSNLDAKLRVSMRAELLRLHRRLRITTIYVTHDQIEAMTMGDRLVVLRQGTVQQVGSPSEIYARPANAFVARFIGSPSMNTFPSAVEIADGAIMLRLASRPLRIDGAPFDVGRRDSVLVGIRPESLVPRPSGEGRIRGELEIVEVLGKEKLLYVKVGDKNLVVVAKADYPGRPGDPVGLDFADGDVHLFDVSDERSLRTDAQATG